MWYCSYFSLYPLTQSKFQNRLKGVSILFDTNKDKSLDYIKSLIEEYINPNTTEFRRLDIKYGQGSGKAYSNKLKEKAKNKLTISNIQFWINRGFSYEEAVLQKKKHYNKISKAAIKAQQLLYKNNPEKKKDRQKKANATMKLRSTIQYWIDQGYTANQADERIKKYNNPPKHDLQTYINKYGDEGYKKQKESYKKRNQTKIDKYGHVILNGYVSKASIRFFKPLYKLLRKSCIAKDDIIWGIGNHREFTTHDTETNKNFAYDFVIRSKKIIIEYNDPFWHARNENEWKNPFVRYSESYNRDKYKQKIAKKMGFDIIYIWADNLPTAELLKNIILNYEQQNIKLPFE